MHNKYNLIINGTAINQQDTQNTYNLIWRPFLATTFIAGKQ